MSVGIQVTKGEIDSRVGQIARDFQKLFRDLPILKNFLDATPDADLIALGYTAGEVATIKTAINDLEQLRGIWLGTSNLANVKDFTTFVRRLWGVGAQ